MRQLLTLAALLPLTAGAAACGTESGSGDDDTEVNCAVETADTFTAGLEKQGTVFDVKLMTANPAPPNRGDNEWEIHVNTLSGAAPVSNATIEVTPFMPKHQHGTPVDVEVVPGSTPGEYTLKKVNLWMPGVWETTIEMTSSSGTDMVVYKFCIPS
jgi:hypothetical protein